MSRHAAARPQRRALGMLGSVRFRALLGLAALLALAAPGTYAHWTDEVTVSGATFTSGTLDLRVDNSDGPVTGYTTMNLSAMVPGNSTAGVLTIRNNGTAPLKYTAVTAATNLDTKNLAGALTVKVTGGNAVTGTSPATTCAGTALTGTGSTLGGALVTTKRTLQPGTTETLCVQVTLPTNANTTLQGATTDVTFTFSATSDMS